MQQTDGDDMCRGPAAETQAAHVHYTEAVLRIIAPRVRNVLRAQVQSEISIGIEHSRVEPGPACHINNQSTCVAEFALNSSFNRSTATHHTLVRRIHNRLA